MTAYIFGLDILKFVISGVITAYALFYFFRHYFDNQLNQRTEKIRLKETETLLPLRLQAHERLLLFVDRINPENILIRLHQSELTAIQLQSLVIAEIRAEYQHNITQQLYIEHTVWESVRKLKDETILLINNATKGLGIDCDATTFSKTILTHMSSIEDNPYHLTLQYIKNQIQDNF